ncbi:MAG: hypothetical protein M1812_006057 [Candelaria pacifica]|nr:MAG: hypothetical protein M1812_006057 [Candelaria pacifica]
MRRPQTCPSNVGNLSNAIMYDRSKNNSANHNNGHPLKPTSSASNKHAKLPSTPRVAGSTTSSASPNLRKGLQHETTVTPKGNQKEDLSTPVKAFLSSNITPRSSSRKSRVGTTTPNSTPNGTPTNARPVSAVGSAQAASDENDERVGLGINGADGGGHRRPRSIVSENAGSTLSPLSRSPEAMSPGEWPPGRPHAGFDNTPKFFHASEAKSFASPHASSKRPPSPTKSSSFVYANGVDHEVSSARSSVGLPAAQEARIQAKFFPAISAPDKDTQPSPKPFNPTKPTLATIPSSQEVPSAQSLTSHQHSLLQHEHTPVPRKSSTISRSSSLNKKPAETASPPSRRLSTSSLGQPRNQPAGTPQRQSSLKGSSSRRSSVDLTPPRRLGHAKSASVGSLDTLCSPNTNPRLRAIDSPSPLTLSNVATLDRASKGTFDSRSPSVTHSIPQSPTKSTSASQNLQQLNELAANARRERKVLDLEISNSSLLAINKTLERELNKQSAELRRFRRLSRSGRLSIATSTGGTVGELSALAESDDGAELSDMAEEEIDDQDYQVLPNDSSKPTMDDGLTSSQGPISASPAPHHHDARDEKPLRLDFSKHQALLVDSQKMNQSIKRCLGWTEELIREGKKALEYRVRVEDIEHLGGRVLPPNETPPEDEESSDENGNDDASVMDKDDNLLLRNVGPLTSESELASMSWDFQSPRDSMSSEKDSGVELEPGEHLIKEGFAKARDMVFRHLRETL